MANEHETPKLLALYHEQVVRPRRQMVRAVLAHAEARNELQANAHLDLAVMMAIGAYYAQYLAGDLFPLDWAERALDTLLRGLLPCPDAHDAEV